MLLDDGKGFLTGRFPCSYINHQDLCTFSQQLQQKYINIGAAQLFRAAFFDF